VKKPKRKSKILDRKITRHTPHMPELVDKNPNILAVVDGNGDQMQPTRGKTLPYTFTPSVRDFTWQFVPNAPATK
jgi:hypothetical protein